MDQSDDEGFQSASNLTPDSQSEQSPLPDIDVWEALRTFEPGRRRCWESVGWYVADALLEFRSQADADDKLLFRTKFDSNKIIKGMLNNLFATVIESDEKYPLGVPGYI